MNRPLELSDYRLPTPSLTALVVEARATTFLPSPRGTAVLILDLEPHPPMELVARSFDALAGIRIDRRTGCRRRLLSIRAASIIDWATGTTTEVSTDTGLPVTIPVWSANGEYLAFGVDVGRGVALAIVNKSGLPVWTGQPVFLNDLVADGGSNGWRHRRSGIAPTPVLWGRDGGSLFCWTREPTAGTGTNRLGPATHDITAGGADLPLFDGVLRSQSAVAKFDELVVSQLLRLDVHSGEARELGSPAALVTVRESPDQRYLLATRLERPFPLGVPFSMFQQSVEVWSAADGSVEGQVVKRSARHRKADLHDIGPRQVFWQEGQQSALLWAEQHDANRPHEDVFRLTPPFGGEAAPQKVGEVEARLVRWVWLDGSSEVLCNVRSSSAGKDRVYRLDTHSGTTELVFERPAVPSTPDCIPLREVRDDGGLVAAVRDGRIFFPDATTRGDRSFVDAVDVNSRREAVRYQVGPASGDVVLGFAEDMTVMLARHTQSGAQFVLHDLMSGHERTVVDTTSGQRTRWAEPVAFQGPDGPIQRATLFRTSASGEPPCLVWLDGRADAQVGPIPALASEDGVHVAFLHPAAVTSGRPPSFGVDVLVRQVHACVDQLIEIGVAPRDRVFLGGHSYGAFLAALVLSHSDRFKGGIGLSGAYSRSLTPFGFQTEARTLWQAPDFYDAVDVVRRAHKITAPMLLVHGELDEVAGTPPVQSELLFRALVANDTAARLVMLPHEGHRYAARESILHVLAELVAWVSH